MVCLVSIQPGPPLLILTYGSNATYECQAQPDLKKFERIKWNITVGGQKYFEVPDIPLCYGKINYFILVFLVLDTGNFKLVVQKLQR